MSDQQKELETCSGDGSCLVQSTKNTYEKGNEYICLFNCVPLKYPNYVVCGQKGSLIVFGCSGGRCVNCDIMFADDLDITNEVKECPICLEEQHYHIKMWECNHRICNECFRHVHYGTFNIEQPVFPYPEKEEEYWNTSDDEFLKDDEKVTEWSKQCDEYDELIKQNIYDYKKIFDKCPLCRNKSLF